MSPSTTTFGVRTQSEPEQSEPHPGTVYFHIPPRKPPHTGIFNCLPPQRSRCHASTCAARKTRIVFLGAAAGVSGSLHWYGPLAHYLVNRIQAIILSGVARASQSKQPQATRFCSSSTAACGTGGIQHPYPKTNAITSVIQQYI